MTQEEHLTVVVPEPLAAEIRAAVEAGEYATTGQAVGDAVQLWSSHRQKRQPDVEALRRAWAAGKASGLHGPLAFDELRVEARRRLAAAKASSDRAG